MQFHIGELVSSLIQSRPSMGVITGYIGMYLVVMWYDNEAKDAYNEGTFKWHPDNLERKHYLLEYL